MWFSTQYWSTTTFETFNFGLIPLRNMPVLCHAVQVSGLQLSSQPYIYSWHRKFNGVSFCWHVFNYCAFPSFCFLGICSRILLPVPKFVKMEKSWFKTGIFFMPRVCFCQSLCSVRLALSRRQAPVPLSADAAMGCVDAPVEAEHKEVLQTLQDAALTLQPLSLDTLMRLLIRPGDPCELRPICDNPETYILFS